MNLKGTKLILNKKRGKPGHAINLMVESEGDGDGEENEEEDEDDEMQSGISDQDVDNNEGEQQ